MVNLVIATTTERKSLVVNGQATLRDVIAENGFNTEGMTYHLNGRPVTNLDAKVADVATLENNQLVAVPAQKAGC